MVFNVLASINVFPATVSDASTNYNTFSTGNIYNLGANRTVFQNITTQSWTSQGNGGQTCAISDNGQYIIFTAKSGSSPTYGIYYSYNSGTDFSFSETNTSSVTGACMSANGAYQYAILNISTTYVYYKNTTSPPGTPSWSTISIPGGSAYRGVNCSSDGKYVVVTGAGLYYSTNYGASGSFTTISTGIANLSAIHSATIVDNSSGNTIYIAVTISSPSTVALYKITNATATPSSTFLASFSTSVATGLSNIVCSTDGKYILCGTVCTTSSKDFFLYSSDSGSTIKNSSTNISPAVVFTTSNVSSATRTRVAMSKTGQYMLASSSNSGATNIFNYSYDYGASWTPITITSNNFSGGNPTTNGLWTGLSINSSGTKAFMASGEQGTSGNYTYKFFLASNTN